MFWDNIKNELLKYGSVKEWADDFMVIKNHDNICGVAIHSPIEISVISHKYSYGGNEDMFEIMPSVDNMNDVDGYLSEKEVIRAINKIVEKYHILNNK